MERDRNRGKGADGTQAVLGCQCPPQLQGHLPAWDQPGNWAPLSPDLQNSSGCGEDMNMVQSPRKLCISVKWKVTKFNCLLNSYTEIRLALASNERMSIFTGFIVQRNTVPFYILSYIHKLLSCCWLKIYCFPYQRLKRTFCTPNQNQVWRAWDGLTDFTEASQCWNECSHCLSLAYAIAAVHGMCQHSLI